jgi:hypothetical protein
MITITATVPCVQPPAWALLERRLFDAMNEAVQPFLDRYVTDEGELIWREGGTGSRDGADDFYESVYNWPLAYLLGGGEHLLSPRPAHLGRHHAPAHARRYGAQGV